MAEAFQSLPIYDRPGVLLSTVLEGEFRAGTLRELAFDPDRLAPRERETILTNLKTRFGSTVVGDAAVDILLNPLTWGLFLTSPGAASAIKRTGRIFTAPKALSAFMEKEGFFLRSLGLNTAQHLTEGTPAVTIARAVSRSLVNGHEEYGGIYGPALGKLLDRLRLPTLDWTKLSDPRAKERARRVSTALQATLEGWDEDVPEFFWRATKGGGYRARTRVQPAMLQPGQARAILLEEGGQEAVDFADSMQRTLDRAKANLFLDAKGEVDPRKISQIYHGVRNRLFSIHNPIRGQANPLNEDGLAIIRDLVNAEVETAIQSGTMSLDTFHQTLKAMVTPTIPQRYFPRNVWEGIVQGNRTLPLDEMLRHIAARSISDAPNAVFRSQRLQMMMPEDLAFAKQMFGGRATAQLDKNLSQTQQILDEARKSGNTVFFRRVNPHLSLHRYLDSAVQTKAWHLEEVGKDVTEAQRRFYEEGRKVTGGSLLSGNHDDDHFAGVGLPIDTVMDGVKASHGTPPTRGNWTLADAMQATAGLTRNPHAQATIIDIIVPTLAGRMKSHEAVMRSSVIRTKEVMEKFSNSKVGQYLEKETGDFGKNFIQTLRNWGGSYTGHEAGQNVSRKIADYFYVTHLGYNMMSVALNVMQPLLSVAPQIGMATTMAAYGDAFRDIGRYMKERAKFGTSMSQAQKRDVIHRTLPFVSGENLLQIGPDALDAIEGIAFKRNPYQRQGLSHYLTAQGALSLFEKGEWVNRLVSAHAVRRSYAKLRPDIWDGNVNRIPLAVQGEIRRFAEETQFGSSMTNTATGLLTDNPRLSTPVGRALANPLGRQFFAFTSRQVTSPFTASPVIGAGVRNTVFGEAPRQLAPFIDIWRALGVSNIAFQMGRHMLDADLSRGLYAQATLDPLGQAADPSKAPFRLPPIIDVPVNLTRALSNGDEYLLRSTLSRLIPGGVAMSRALSIAPKHPDALKMLDRFSGRKTFVDWSNPSPQGYLPVYDYQGKLVEYKDWPTLMGKAIGLDFGKFNDHVTVEKFFLKQGEVIREARRGYLAALLANDVSGASAIENDFRKKYGVSLPISVDQIRAAIRLRTVPRPERIVDQSPREYRQAFTKILAENRGLQLGMRPDQFVLGQTANERNQFRDPSLNIDPRVIEIMRRKLQVGGAATPERTNAFQSFQGYQNS